VSETSETSETSQRGEGEKGRRGERKEESFGAVEPWSRELAGHAEATFT